jgi:hypothetical protein
MYFSQFLVIRTLDPYPDPDSLKHARSGSGATTLLKSYSLLLQAFWKLFLRYTVFKRAAIILCTGDQYYVLYTVLLIS